MVAYSFKRFFAPQIVLGSKSQTVRANRKRHARPGEELQLFQGMRTRNCRKIIDDPTCRAVSPIVLTFDSAGTGMDWIEIAGTSLDAAEMEEFARKDGFDPAHVDLGGETALENLVRFWTSEHGKLVQFEGVLIEWAPSP